MPLGVLKVRGYDVELLEKNTPEKCKKYDRQLGWLYKVAMHKEGQRGEKGSRQEEAMKADFKKRKIIKAEAKKMAEQEENNSDEEPDESSDSSDGEKECQVKQTPQQALLMQLLGMQAPKRASGNAKGKNANKARTEKALAAEATKKEKAEQKLADKAARELKAVAVLAVEKVPEHLLMLTTALSDRLIDGMPRQFVQPAKDTLDKMMKLVREAKRSLLARMATWLASPTKKALLLIRALSSSYVHTSVYNVSLLL